MFWRVFFLSKPRKKIYWKIIGIIEEEEEGKRSQPFFPHQTVEAVRLRASESKLLPPARESLQLKPKESPSDWWTQRGDNRRSLCEGYLHRNLS